MVPEIDKISTNTKCLQIWKYEHGSILEEFLNICQMEKQNNIKLQYQEQFYVGLQVWTS